MKSFKFRSNLIWLLIGFFLIAALTGCGRTDSATETETASEPAAQSDNESVASETATQTLVVAGPADFDRRAEVKRNVYDTFLQIDDNGVPQVSPLVTKFEQSDDGTVHTFTIAEGKTFHDGTPWDTKAAEWFIKWLQNGPRSKHFKTISDVKIDGSTVVVTLSEPTILFTKTLASDFRGVVPSPESLETPWSLDADMKAETFSGTGKFKVTSYTNAQGAVLERVDPAGGAGTLIDRIEYRVIPDDQASVSALRAGDVDIIGAADHHATVPFEAVPMMHSDPNIVVEERSYGRYQVVEFNTVEGPASDKRVRQALNMALNRDDMVAGLLGGAAEPAWTVIPGRYPYGAGLDAQAYSYDVDAAKTVLDEAGWVEGSDGIREKDGQKLVMRYVVPQGESNAEPVAVYLQSEFKKVGVDVDIQVMESGAASGERKEGNYDMFLHHSYGVPGIPEALLTGKYHSSASWAASLHSPELDAMIDAAVATHDDALYSKAYNYVQQEYAMLPLYDIEKIVAYNKKVKNFTFPSSVYAIDLSMIAIEE